MAIADTISSMYENVGEVYDTITNVDLPTNKNIENIPSTIRKSYLDIMNNGIDTIYDNWEKVNGTGTSISLNNTEEAPMTIDLKGNTSQATTTGKNLLPNNGTIGTINGITFTKNADGSVLVNGTATSNTMYYLLLSSENISISAGNYYISGCPSNGSAETYRLVIGVGDTLYGEYGTGRAITISAGVLTSYIYITRGATVNNLLYKPMLTSGSTATEYEPYTNGASPNPDYPQDIHVVSGDNTIKVEGKNLAKSFSQPTYNIYNDILDIGIDNINALMGQTITISFDSNKTGKVYENENFFTTSLPIDIVVGRNTITRVVKSDLVEKVTTYADGKWRILKNYVSTNECIFTNIQLELGNTATTFEEYKGASYEINLGKNLLNNILTTQTLNGITATRNNDGSVTLNGTATAQTDFAFLNTKLELEDGTYTFSISNSGNSNVRIQYGVTGYGIMDTGTATTSYTTTFPNTSLGTEYSYINMFRVRVVNGAVLNNYTIYPMIEKGSQATSYSPYFTPIELCKIGTYQDRIFKSSGKNLLNNLNTQIGIAWNNATNSARAVCYVKVKPNTTYSISLINVGVLEGVYYFGKENTTDSVLTIDIGQITTPRTITTTSTTNYIGIQYNKTNITQANVESAIVMLNEGSTALPYEPYGKDWYLNKQIGKVVLNGTENWSLRSDVSQTNNYYTFRNDDYVEGAFSTNSNGYSNYFKIVSSAIINKNNIRFINATGYGTQICISGDIVQTAEALKLWLNNHNVTVYYRLTTPTYEKITGELLNQLEIIKKSYENQTNINQENNDLPFELEVGALEKY